MFTGHLGLALGAHGMWPRVPLWALVVAALLPDLVNTAWQLTGRGDPGDLQSHAWLPAGLAAAVMAIGYFVGRRDRGGAAVLAGVVLSHLLADYVTSREPTWPGGPRIGLHWYRYDLLDFTVEGSVVILGWWLYRRQIPQVARRAWPLGVMLGALLLFQFLFQLLPIT